MRRMLAVLAGILLVACTAATASASTPNHRSAAAPRAASSEDEERRLLCNEGDPLCAETADAIGYEGRYTGHDEPSLLFTPTGRGRGTTATGWSCRRTRRPCRPRTAPAAPSTSRTGSPSGSGWTCATTSRRRSSPTSPAPQQRPQHLRQRRPSSPRYIGRHPGTAFLELQFHPPGWVSFENAISCDAFKWCAAMAIFSVNSDQNTGVPNSADCLDKVSIEPANFAFITRNGRPQAPPAPLDLTTAAFTPNPARDLFMRAGDHLDISIHDSPAGLVTRIDDLSSGQSGSMTASVANGFAQVNYEPDAATCTQTPYAFHPMYSTSSEHTRVPWAAHSSNVAFSDEIGHFEYCSSVNPDGTCAEGVNDRAGPTATTSAASGPRSRCGCGSAAASAPTPTSTGCPTSGPGRARWPTPNGTAGSIPGRSC